MQVQHEESSRHSSGLIVHHHRCDVVCLLVAPSLFIREILYLDFHVARLQRRPHSTRGRSDSF